MLLRNRISGIDSGALAVTTGYEHLPLASVAVLRWLNASGVDYVVVGPVARAARGDASVRGPAAIVPAPYGRNLDRLARALVSVSARARPAPELIGVTLPEGAGSPLKLAAEQLLHPAGLSLRCGDYDLDIEGRPDGVPSYQELLFEAVSFELADGVAAEIASPEDIELYDHIRRTGVAPEMMISRVEPAATA